MINFLRLKTILPSEGFLTKLTKNDGKTLFKKKKSKEKADKENSEEEIIEDEVSTSGGGDNNDDNNDKDDNNQGEEKTDDNSSENDLNENNLDEDKEEEKTEEENSEEQEDDNTIVGPWGATVNNSEKNTSNAEDKNKYDNLINDLINKKSFNRKLTRKPSKPSGTGFGGGNNGNYSGGGGGSFIDKLSESPKRLILTIILLITSVWLASGFYKVNSDENALVLYFGKYHTIATPGLNYHIPFPIGKAVIQSVTTVNSEEFGYTSRNNTINKFGRRGTQEGTSSENLMLTGDENIVDIEFQVQWQIKDIEKFTFNIAEPRLTIRKSAESAMREIIAVTPISEALSDGKSNIEQESRKLLQQILDDYGAGVRIVLLQLRRVDPPTQVIDSFRDVQTARADKEKEINEAQAYANDIIPRARGNAAEMQEQALAYKSRVTADAQGEANRFLALHKQYKTAKEVTRKRMYLETMQEVYGDIDKVIIDNNLSKGSLMPYFPLGDLNNRNTSGVIKK